MTSKLKPHTKRLSQAARRQATICKAKLTDIAPVFNLIQEYSGHDYFNKVYLQPRYQAGLALQLFSVWLLGKIRLPCGSWHRARLQVIHHEGQFAGFILTRHLLPAGENQEIYMCAVESGYWGNGFGRILIQSVLESLEGHSIIEIECTPQTVYMVRLLNRMGFKSVSPAQSNALSKFCLKVADSVRHHEK